MRRESRRGETYSLLITIVLHLCLPVHSPLCIVCIFVLVSIHTDLLQSISFDALLLSQQ